MVLQLGSSPKVSVKGSVIATVAEMTGGAEAKEEADAVDGSLKGVPMIGGNRGNVLGRQMTGEPGASLRGR